MSSRRLLMCAPEAYGLLYEINPWMKLENQPDLVLAAGQWEVLYRILTRDLGATVELVQQDPGAPDMVFTANAGMVRDGRVFLSRFRHPERSVEEAPFRAWFEARGYEVLDPPVGVHFEGEGDALFAGSILVAGYLKRSDIAAHRWLTEALGVPALSLELVDPRWYHLDTAFCALTPDLVVYYPGAFDEYARRVVEANFATIQVSDEEAARFACNAIAIGGAVIMPSGCPMLREELEQRGLAVYTLEMSEFIKCGGAAKCLTLFLDGHGGETARAASQRRQPHRFREITARPAGPWLPVGPSGSPPSRSTRAGPPGGT